MFLCCCPDSLLRTDTSSGEAAWQSVFHAVSSFNNAGFALYTDNLIGFAEDPFICLPLCAAIILGGLGFPVIMQLRKEFRRPLHWTMNTKFVLWGTAVLLVLGTVYITVIEWDNPTLSGGSILRRRPRRLLPVRPDPHRRVQLASTSAHA